MEKRTKMFERLMRIVAFVAIAAVIPGKSIMVVFVDEHENYSCSSAIANREPVFVDKTCISLYGVNSIKYDCATTSSKYYYTGNCSGPPDSGAISCAGFGEESSFPALGTSCSEVPQSSLVLLRKGETCGSEAGVVESVKSEDLFFSPGCVRQSLAGFSSYEVTILDGVVTLKTYPGSDNCTEPAWNTTTGALNQCLNGQMFTTPVAGTDTPTASPVSQPPTLITISPSSAAALQSVTNAMLLILIFTNGLANAWV